jgi:hypothetical protein
LTPGQHVCCSAGDLPDFRPKPLADGTCFSYTTKKDDNCATIAASNAITVDDIESFNKETWGWMGCNNLGYSQTMCLSKGNPSIPVALSNAVCGPQVPGTAKPTNGTKLADLNPCKLNACCNIWGQCGITKDFCTVSKSTTGAPGTSAPGENGCVSNCGIEVPSGTNSPFDFRNVVYFEGWNFDRPCLNMDIIDMAKYKGNFSHIHFAFANITHDMEVDN